jgi:hypothetical protein
MRALMGAADKEPDGGISREEFRKLILGEK